MYYYYKDNAVGNVVAETGRVGGTTTRLSGLSMPFQLCASPLKGEVRRSPEPSARPYGEEGRFDVAARSETPKPPAKTTNSNSCDREVAQVKDHKPEQPGWKYSNTTYKYWTNIEKGIKLRQDPPWFEFWSFLTFLHHGIEDIETHRLWKFHK